jgi:enoyl-CoA hydratase/carnithine racemase
LPDLLLEPHNGVLHITLNRPDSRNAMSLQMVSELRAVLAAVRDDRATRAVVWRRRRALLCRRRHQGHGQCPRPRPMLTAI